MAHAHAAASRAKADCSIALSGLTSQVLSFSRGSVLYRQPFLHPAFASLAPISVSLVVRLVTLVDLGTQQVNFLVRSQSRYKTQNSWTLYLKIKFVIIY